MNKPEVLVAGAGPALAYWLVRNGHRPTVVEQARGCAPVAARSS
jgi:2-polyprenyl-6-methoxyphenol hydroxylase-like FAD-dependent oxidoreductase